MIPIILLLGTAGEPLRWLHFICIHSSCLSKALLYVQVSGTVYSWRVDLEFGAIKRTRFSCYWNLQLVLLQDVKKTNKSKEVSTNQPTNSLIKSQVGPMASLTVKQNDITNTARTPCLTGCCMMTSLTRATQPTWHKQAPHGQIQVKHHSSIG